MKNDCALVARMESAQLAYPSMTDYGTKIQGTVDCTQCPPKKKIPRHTIVFILL